MSWISRILWKARFAARFWRLTRTPLVYSWQCAESWMEMLDGDTSESTSECVDEEIYESMRN
jgi:hypothetical protein